MRNGLKFVAQKGDLLQVSYLRSGTNWVQYIVQLILRGGAPLNNYDEFLQHAHIVEYYPRIAQLKTSAPVRTLRTHLPLTSEKLNPEAKYVYVARNPWDVCVSLYHFVTSISVYRFRDGTFDDLLEAFLTGCLPYGSYFDHLVAGYSLKDEPNVLFVTLMALKRLKPYAQIIDGVLSQKRNPHWVQYIIQLILREGEPIDTFEEFSQRARIVEYYADISQFKTSGPMRTLRTHLPLRLEKLNPEAKYVYVARNPWDVCVSLYHLVTSLSFYRFQDGTFDDFLEAFWAGCLPYGCYFEHLVAGYSLKDEPNVLFLTYEELQRDVREVVLRLASFIGEHYGQALKENEVEGRKLLDVIIKNSSAERMKKVMVFNFRECRVPDVDRRLKSLDISTKSAHEGDVKRHNCVRNCEVGKWKEYFSPEQLRRMEATIRKKTTGSSVMDLWSDMRVEALRLSRENSTPET
ncbi:hypothetical protein MTO96_015059 [Rhipicephalus appendiculatus]